MCVALGFFNEAFQAFAGSKQITVFVRHLSFDLRLQNDNRARETKILSNQSFPLWRLEECCYEQRQRDVHRIYISSFSIGWKNKMENDTVKSGKQESLTFADLEQTSNQVRRYHQLTTLPLYHRLTLPIFPMQIPILHKSPLSSWNTYILSLIFIIQYLFHIFSCFQWQIVKMFCGNYCWQVVSPLCYTHCVCIPKGHCRYLWTSSPITHSKCVIWHLCP